MITLSPEVAAAYPEAEIHLVVARGLVNTGWSADLTAVEDGFLPYDETTPEILSWHEAFRAFGTNPRRMRPSVDALSRRLARTGRLPRINPAVDAYNLVSVRHGVPAGAFDLDRLPGPVEVRYAADGDEFVPLGEPDVVEKPNAGEVVYASGSTVLTRHWNHRDADPTKLTPATANAVFILERVSAVVPGLHAAEAELADLLRPHAAAIELATISSAG
jgi:DNA/RNA-binding domain of Phe-tRNA-synthetase-like protein